MLVQASSVSITPNSSKKNFFSNGVYKDTGGPIEPRSTKVVAQKEQEEKADSPQTPRRNSISTSLGLSAHLPSFSLLPNLNDSVCAYLLSLPSIVPPPRETRPSLPLDPKCKFQGRHLAWQSMRREPSMGVSMVRGWEPTLHRACQRTTTSEKQGTEVFTWADTPKAIYCSCIPPKCL